MRTPRERVRRIRAEPDLFTKFGGEEVSDHGDRARVSNPVRAVPSRRWRIGVGYGSRGRRGRGPLPAGIPLPSQVSVERGVRRMVKGLGKATAVCSVCAVAAPLFCARRFRTERREPVVWSPGKGETLLIKNAEIVDVVGGTMLHRRSVLVREGRIVEVATEKKAEEVTYERVLDVSGAYVIPGLINAHCHALLPSTLSFTLDVLASMRRQVERCFEECVVHGVTTIRDAGSLPLLLKAFAERIERGELLGPRLFFAGAFINVPGGYPDFMPPMPAPLADKWGRFGYQVRTPGEVEEAVERNAGDGACFIKTAFDDRSLFVGQRPLSVMDDDLLVSLVKAAHERGLKVSAHHRFRRGFRRGVDFGLDGMEHLPADEVLDEDEVDRFVSAGMYVVPTVSVAWALSGMSRGDPFLDDPLVRRSLENRGEILRTIYPSLFEPPVYRSILRAERNARDPSFPERRHLMYVVDPTIFTQGLVVGRENLNRLYHAGALIGCGNDGGVPQLTPALLGLEMVLLAEITDMTPMDVLRSATINNARILGMEGELGSVEKGKLADLVILPGNPLQNMEHILRPNAVFKEGRLVYSDRRFEVR